MLLLFDASTLSLAAGALCLADTSVLLALLFFCQHSRRGWPHLHQRTLWGLPKSFQMVVVALPNASLDSTGFDIDGKWN
jgi:hypothetical protein